MIAWLACSPPEPTSTSSDAVWSWVEGERVELALAGEPPQVTFDVWVEVDPDMLGSSLGVQVTAWSFGEELLSLDLWQITDDDEVWLAGEVESREPYPTVGGGVPLAPGSSSWRFRVESSQPGEVAVTPTVRSFHLPREWDDASTAEVTPVDPQAGGAL